MSNSKALTGRNALVTGSARRIGRQIALELAGRGANVMIHTQKDEKSALETVKMVRALGVKSELVLADITQESEVKKLIDSTVKYLGGIDILVNSAAIRRPVPFVDMTFSEWRLIMSIILDGTFLCCHAAAPYLKKSKHATRHQNSPS